MSTATLIDTLQKAEKYFAEKKIPSPRLEAQLLFAHFLKLRRIDLFTQGDRPIHAAELEVLRQALREKAGGKPTAYILGEKDFYGRAFRVTGDVLIPRPESEELIEHTLKLAPQAAHVVDLGAGSGCLGVTLALELKSSRLSLVDISPSALAVAASNARRHGIEAQNNGPSDSAMEFHSYEVDFTEPAFCLTHKADIVVSNPPYVLPEEFAALDAGVRGYEPKLALVAENFEDLHRGLLTTAHRHLASGGLAAIETHPQKSADVAEWARFAGFVDVEIRNDFAGRPHFVFGRR